MKMFIFRCQSRPEMHAATRYETGSNLPRSRCSGGWLFSELVDLKAEGSPSRLGIKIDELQRRVRQQGYHVWESGVAAPALADSEIALEPPPPPPLATFGVEPPAVVELPAEVVPLAVDPPRRRAAAPAAKAPPA